MEIGAWLSTFLTFDAADGALTLAGTRVGVWNMDTLMTVHHTFKDVLGDDLDRVTATAVTDSYRALFQEVQAAVLGDATDELNAFLTVLTETGVGRVERVETPAPDRFVVHDSIEAAYYQEQVAEKQSEPVCRMLQAKLAAALATVHGTVRPVTEERCQVLGDDACVFEVGS